MHSGTAEQKASPTDAVENNIVNVESTDVTVKKICHFPAVQWSI
jgi:hypothetical protein